MREIQMLVEHIDEEIHDAECYARLALEYRERDRELADLFYRLSGEELDHMVRLHGQVSRLIDARKKGGAEIPEAMLAVYEYLHKRQIDRTAEVAACQALYKNK